MAYTNRYYLYENPFMSEFTQGNSYFFGGDLNETKDVYLKIPFVLGGKYYNKQASSEMIFYYNHEYKQVCGVSITGGRISDSLPCEVFCPITRNGQGIYYNGTTLFEPALISKIEHRLKKDNFAIKKYWSGGYSNTSPLGKYYPVAGDRDDVMFTTDSYSKPGVFIAEDIKFPIKNQNYAITSIDWVEEKTSSVASNKFFSESLTFNYLPVENGKDITPSDKRIYEDIKAGEWSNGRYKIFLGMPFYSSIFKEKVDEDTWEEREIKMYAHYTEVQTTYTNKDSDIDPTIKDYFTVDRRILLKSDQSDYKLEYIREFNQIWNGTSRDYVNNYYLAFGYDQKEKNNGFYKKQLPSSGDYNTLQADEEQEDQYVDLIHTTEHDQVKITYLGNSLEANMFQKFYSEDDVNMMRLRNYVIKDGINFIKKEQQQQ